MEQSLTYFREAGDLGNQSTALVAGISPALAPWQQGTLDAKTAISQEQGNRSSFEALVASLDSLDGRISSAIEAAVNNEQNIPELQDSGAPQIYLADAHKLAAEISSYVKDQEFSSVVRQYTIANGDLEKRTEDREAEFNQGNSLIQGVSREREGNDTYTAYYPTEGLAILTQMTGNLGSDIETARALIARYNAEPADLRSAAELNALNTSNQDLLARLLDLQGKSTPIIANAKTQVNRASSLKIEGDRLFQAAQTALNRNDFDNARSNLTRAADQYDASLAIQESDTLRSYRDSQVVKLGDDIVGKENEIVVRDVRSLVTQAQNSYYAGNMDQAEQLLVTAQNRWHTTNVTDHQDVEYWLSLVRGAMSLQSGRTIAPTAPLYAEMSQLLSDATRSYNDGVSLIKSGKRSDGLAKFNEAMEKTKEIRLMFPLNHDARMLELRIEQQTDLQAFNTAFRQRINEAVSGTKTKNAESYAELQDLAEINPQYPGIKAILTQAEIDMGFRPPPPNPADLARSTDLARSAQTIINSRDTTRYEVAMTQLNEAIRLNPVNTQAQSYIDQLSILMYGTGTIVFSNAAQNQYNAALQEFLKGNYLSANAIVQQLLQNPEYQKSIQLQDLKRRIDSVL